MSNARKLSTINKLANEAYRSLATTVDRIGGPGCQIKPVPAEDVFEKTSDEHSIKLVVKPIALRLKERASSNRADIIAVVKGKVHFSKDADRLLPLSCYYETEVGYFRKRGELADHIFGVHYDNDLKTAGHPVFHAQFKSTAELLGTANALLNESLAPGTDQMAGVEGKIRVPTAHMDPFSVFLQLVADHLLNVNSDEVQKATFEAVRTALSFFRSDPARATRLEEARRLNCFRASHWYPLPAKPVPVLGPDDGSEMADTAAA